MPTLIKDLSMKAARELCAGYSNGCWCEGCPLMKKKCLRTYLTSSGAEAERIGNCEVPDTMLDKLWSKGIKW